MKREPYLLNKKFLKKLDNENIKTLIARITILSWDEKPIADFTGKVLPGGTASLDGNSSMRRTCNLSLSLDENEINITKVENLISINKKVTLEIGIYNTLNDYKEFEIIWFPLGIYVMIQPSISRSTSGTTLSLQLKDKMCLLNGEVGGTLPASITLSEMGYTDNDGNEFIEHPTIFQIIFELVNHFGGEQLGNIIISDLDTRIRKVMKWNSSNYPLYWKESENSNSDDRQFLYKTEAELEQMDDQTGWQTYEFNEDVGFIYTDFIWPEEELIADVGETICGVLDKITGMLSNFEYFYDIYGKFHFQEKKNYLNTTQATTFTRQMQRLDPTNGSRRYTLISQNDYLIDLSNGKAEYVFDDNNLITSYTNVPQFNLIKNDFLIWGLRKTADGTTLPIRYHLAIDKKPETGIPHIVVLYKDKSDGLIKAASAEDKELKKGEYKLGHFYCEAKKSKVIFIDENIEKFAYAGNDGVVWISLLGLDATLYKYDFVEENGVKTNRKELIRVEQKEGEIYLAAIVPNDWRTELYLQGIEAEATATDSNYYYPELLNEWPKLFDLEKNRFRTEILVDPSSMDYYLDFIDSNSAIGEFSINNIGRRTYATVDDKINCVFSNSLQTECIILKPGETATEAITKGEYGYSNVSDDVYKNLVQGGNQNSAFGKVREMLYQYTSYCENITLQAIPIYYLDVNTRITVQDIKSNIFGDYLITRITLPLDCSGLMTINATRALDRDKAIINPPEQIVEGRNNEFSEFSNKIDHIRITQLPNKLSYLENELIDITGIIVHGYDIDNNDLGVIPESLINHTIYARNPNSNKYTIDINVNLNNKLMTDSYVVDIAINIIPLMTSNSTPVGNVICNDIQGVTGVGVNVLAAGTENNYYVFDRNDSTGVSTVNENVNGTIEYDFPIKVTVEKVEFSAGIGSMPGYYKDFVFRVDLYYDNQWNTYGTIPISNEVALPAPINLYSISQINEVSGVTKIRLTSETQKTYGNGWVLSELQAKGYIDFVFNGGYIIKDGYLTHYPCHTGDNKHTKYLLDSQRAGYGSYVTAYTGGTYENFDNVRLIPSFGEGNGVIISAGSRSTWYDNGRLETCCFFMDTPLTLNNNRIQIDFSITGHHSYSRFSNVNDTINLIIIQHPEKLSATKSIITHATELGYIGHNIYTHIATTNYNDNNLTATWDLTGVNYENCLLGIMIIKAHNGDGITSDGGSYCQMTINNWNVTPIKTIYSAIYPNADVYDAGIVSVNNGSRSPVTKVNSGDSVVFCVRNGQGTAYGGNWMVTICIALTPEAARLTAPNTGVGINTYTYNNTTYYLSGQSSNASWGGATEISSPIEVPIFDDWYIWPVNGSVSQAQFEEIMQRLDIQTNI